jgi:hypothetical protein
MSKLGEVKEEIKCDLEERKRLDEREKLRSDDF